MGHPAFVPGITGRKVRAVWLGLAPSGSFGWVARKGARYCAQDDRAFWAWGRAVALCAMPTLATMKTSRRWVTLDCARTAVVGLRGLFALVGLLLLGFQEAPHAV